LFDAEGEDDDGYQINKLHYLLDKNDLKQLKNIENSQPDSNNQWKLQHWIHVE
jgi:hypothetical protein